MNPVILNSLISLSGIGVFLAVILYMIAKKFKVYENPKIDEIESFLPSANCGACGYTGCRAFAENLVKTNEADFSNFFCPVGGNNVMKKIAEVLQFKALEKEKTVAVLRCKGSKQNAPSKNEYKGISSCYLAHLTYSGESGCAYGCLGLGDCIDVCKFDALHLDEETGLPVVDTEKCTSCGACVKKCPRHLFEIRPKSDKYIYVACMNQDKGAVAKKNCKVACIGCGRCAKVYETDDVVIENNLSYIKPQIDVENYGGLIVGSCPTNAIVGVGVEPLKPSKNKKEN